MVSFLWLLCLFLSHQEAPKSWILEPVFSSRWQKVSASLWRCSNRKRKNEKAREKKERKDQGGMAMESRNFESDLRSFWTELLSASQMSECCGLWEKLEHAGITKKIPSRHTSPASRWKISVYKTNSGECKATGVFPPPSGGKAMRAEEWEDRLETCHIVSTREERTILHGTGFLCSLMVAFGSI